ncbi:hypothetical protein AO392_14595 [Pseudomonas putida]|uniref:hypothetical protein n=1 Tax=Pseudomonas putida TaxID=303 RepID=UPI0007315B69|nr:hypothetical protein [Pseudomonas putida]KTC25450.1 hypothetical protein AO392_14595 [Pseudomonas putida]
MDTNKMREQANDQFDAFYARYEATREGSGWMPLEAHVVARMRHAWQASREAVVVELPGPCEYADPQGEYAKGHRIGKRDVVAAIEAHGLKVKP